jgi:dethiobiotin synthetase
MTNHDDEAGKTTPSGTLSAAAKQAQHAMDSAKEFVTGTDLDQLRAKAADTASALYQEGRDLLANREEELTKAKDQLSDSIRKNPLAAVGIAFTAGLLLALLFRG